MTSEVPQRPAGRLLLDISNAMVGLQKEFAGRGPEKCKTHWAGPDALLVLMGGGYTAVEATLHDGGRGDSVKASRAAYQDVMEQRVIETIEDLTGRKVAAFMSASRQSPDLMAEVFVFEPEKADPENPLVAEDRSVEAQ